MSKDYVMQLEATIKNLRRDNQLLKEELSKYKAIDNSNPSEALECLEEIINYYNEPIYDVCENSYHNELKEMWEKELNTIKQALLKAQEQEKENELLKEIIKRY